MVTVRAEGELIPFPRLAKLLKASQSRSAFWKPGDGTRKTHRREPAGSLASRSEATRRLFESALRAKK